MPQGEETLAKQQEALRECDEVIRQWKDGLIETDHAFNLAIHQLMSAVEKD